MLRFQMLQSIVSPGLSPRMRAASSATQTCGVRSPASTMRRAAASYPPASASSDVTERVRRKRRSKLRSGRFSIGTPLIAVMLRRHRAGHLRRFLHAGLLPGSDWLSACRWFAGMSSRNTFGMPGGAMPRI